MRNQQAGYGSILILVLILVVASLAALASLERQEQRRDAHDQIDNTAMYIEHVQTAALDFFRENGEWPDSLEQINIENGQTPFGTSLDIEESTGDRFALAFDTNSEREARTIATLLVQGFNAGIRVESHLPAPFDVPDDDYMAYVRRVESSIANSNVFETSINANEQNFNNAGNVNAGLLSGATATVDDLSSSETVIDDTLNVGAASIVSSGNEITVNAISTALSNIRAQQASMSEVTSSGSVAADTFSGTNFTASDVGANENQIFLELTALQASLDDCMYESEYCFPQAPVISDTSCSSCTNRVDRENFTATIFATVSDCRHGCSYSWEFNNAAGTCSSGTVAAGATSDVSCTVSGSLGPQESLLDTVKLVATSNLDNTLVDTESWSINWFNEEPDDTPFDYLKAGCLVYTNAIDVVSEGSCSGYGVMGAHHSRGVQFAVGDEYVFNNTVLRISEPDDFDVSWSGDCISNGVSCSITGYFMVPATFVATVRVTEISSGRVFTKTVTALDCTGTETEVMC